MARFQDEKKDKAAYCRQSHGFGGFLIGWTKSTRYGIVTTDIHGAEGRKTMAFDWLKGSNKPKVATPSLVIEWDECRNGKGQLFLGGKTVGEKVRAHAWKHRLPIWHVFREAVLPAFKNTPEGISASELFSIATYCGPEKSHSGMDAIVILYRAMGLTPENARQTLRELLEESAGDRTKEEKKLLGGLDHDKILQEAFYDAEFMLGLPSGTLYDSAAWGSMYPKMR